MRRIGITNVLLTVSYQINLPTLTSILVKIYLSHDDNEKFINIKQQQLHHWHDKKRIKRKLNNISKKNYSGQNRLSFVYFFI